MTPHEQVRLLWRSVAQEYVISPVTRGLIGRKSRLVGWCLWHGEEVLKSNGTAQEVRFIRDREIARSILRRNAKDMGFRNRELIAGQAARDPLGPENYIRELIISAWVHEVFAAMEETRQ